MMYSLSSKQEQCCCNSVCIAYIVKYLPNIGAQSESLHNVLIDT